MRLFETKSIWDAEFQKWQEVYFIDNKHVEPEVYFEELAAEEYIIADECDCECEDCSCEEDFECDCIDCTLEKYVEMIQEVAPCPHCIREVLQDFLVCVLDHTSPGE